MLISLLTIVSVVKLRMMLVKLPVRKGEVELDVELRVDVSVELKVEEEEDVMDEEEGPELDPGPVEVADVGLDIGEGDEGGVGVGDDAGPADEPPPVITLDEDVTELVKLLLVTLPRLSKLLKLETLLELFDTLVVFTLELE